MAKRRFRRIILWLDKMKKFLVGIFLFLSINAFAACPQLYPPGFSVQIPNTIELCNSFFVTQYSLDRKTPIFSVERLVVGKPVGAINRSDSFRADLRIPNKQGPVLADYLNSGWDRGHLVPSDDASTASEMFDTFLLSNMTPQNPTLNRVEWAKLERVVRLTFSNAKTNMFVITIPVFKAPVSLIRGLPIPSGYWKIVIVDGTEKYYYADNTTISHVKEFTGVNWKALIR